MPDDPEPRRARRRAPAADIVGALGALVILSSAVIGWAGTSGGITGNGDLRPSPGVVRSVEAFTPAPLVFALVPLWSFGRRLRGRPPLPGWALVVAGALVLLVLAAGGVHLVSAAVGHQPPEVYDVPEAPVAVAAVGASVVIIAGLAGIFAASPALSRRRD